MPKGPLRPQDCVQTQVPLVRTQKGIRPQKSLQIHEPARVPIENGQQIVAAPFDIHGPVRHPLPSLAQLIAELPQLRGLLPDLHVSRFTPASPDHQPPIALPPLNPPPPDLGSLNMRLPLLGLPNISRQRITAELTSLGLPTNGSPMNQWERLLTYRYKEYQRQGWSVYPKFYVRPVPFDSRGSDPRTLIGHSIRSILQSSNTKAIIRFADATPDRRLVLVPKIRKEVLLPVSVEIDMEIQRRLDQAPRIVDASVAVGRMPAEHGSYGMLGLRVGDMTKMAYVRIVFRRVQVEFGGDLWLDR